MSAVVALVALAGCGDNRTGGQARLTLAPSAATVPAGVDRVLAVEYVAGDGQPGAPDAVVFTSRSPQIATVTRAADGGAIVHGVAIGPAVIEAAVDDEALDAAALISVIAPEVDRIAIEPSAVSVPDGLCLQVTVIATRTDGSTQVVDPERVEWSSQTDRAVVTDGSVCGLRQGEDSVEARYREASASCAVSITPAIPVAIDLFVPTTLLRVGATTDARAFSRWSDGHSEDVTDQATWSSDRPTIATVAATGQITGVGVGTAQISAELGAITGSTSIQVLTPMVVDLFLDPVEASIASGGLVNLTAIAIYNDNTFEDITATATWTSDQPTIATVDHGLVRGISVGTALVHVSVPGFSRSSLIHVSP